MRRSSSRVSAASVPTAAPAARANQFDVTAHLGGVLQDRADIALNDNKVLSV